MLYSSSSREEIGAEYQNLEILRQIENFLVKFQEIYEEKNRFEVVTLFPLLSTALN
jgi:hypothetical protein